jgi:hypothetical protein
MRTTPVKFEALLCFNDQDELDEKETQSRFITACRAEVIERNVDTVMIAEAAIDIFATSRMSVMTRKTLDSLLMARLKASPSNYEALSVKVEATLNDMLVGGNGAVRLATPAEVLLDRQKREASKIARASTREANKKTKQTATV